MSGSDIILDTNILLYYLNGDQNVRKFIEDNNAIISFISELELLSGSGISKNEKLLIKDLLKDLTIINYSDSHKNDIVNLRGTKKLRLPDAIIASLAMTLNIPLVTADKALKNIDGLDLIFYKVPDAE